MPTDNTSGKCVKLLLLAFVLFTFSKSVSGFFNLSITSGDYAIAEQYLFNTLRGEWFHSTFEGGNHLAVHFSPVLMLLVPLFYVSKSAIFLMLAGSVCFAVGVYMMYIFLSSKIDQSSGVFLVLVLLFHSTLTNDFVRDFHPLSLLPLPFIGAFISYQKKNLRSFVIWCALIACIRENLFIVLLCWGGISLCQRRSAKWILWPTCLAVLQFLIVYALSPLLFNATLSPSIADYYAGYGDSTNEIMTAVWSNPLLPVEFIFQPAKAHYVWGILVPFLIILPFFRWWWVPAIPTFMAIIASSNGRLDHPKLHYSIEIVLWLALSSAILFRDNPGFFRKEGVKRVAKSLLLISILLFTFKTCIYTQRAIAGATGARYKNFSLVREQIPHDASVIAPRYLANHLAKREKIAFIQEAKIQNSWEGYDLLVIEEDHLDMVPPGWEKVLHTGSVLLFKPKTPL